MFFFKPRSGWPNQWNQLLQSRNQGACLEAPGSLASTCLRERFRRETMGIRKIPEDTTWFLNMNPLGDDFFIDCPLPQGGFLDPS